jgi:hypothetical protein
MCLIITQRKGLTLSRTHLLDIFARNGDGFGIMRADRGALHTWRIVGSADDMLALYYAHAAGRECVLHWRMATHGATNAANAHPFPLTRDIAVVHNGVLDIGTPTRGMSDTWHMAQHVLAPIARDNADALFTGDMVNVLGGMIGTSNKLVFLHADGRLAVVNRASGVEHNGCWYSNTYAWDAPASLRPKYTTHRYTSPTWDDVEDWRTLPTGATANSTSTCTPCTLDVPELQLDDDAERRALDALQSAIRDDLHGAYDTHGELGVLEWVREYPRHAVEALCEGYQIDPEDAERHVQDSPASVAEWLGDLLHADAL